MFVIQYQSHRGNGPQTTTCCLSACSWPPSQQLEPPANPERFTAGSGRCTLPASQEPYGPTAGRRWTRPSSRRGGSNGRHGRGARDGMKLAIMKRAIRLVRLWEKGRGPPSTRIRPPETANRRGLRLPCLATVHLTLGNQAYRGRALVQGGTRLSRPELYSGAQAVSPLCAYLGLRVSPTWPWLPCGVSFGVDL
jgi:hypothetical protein